MRGFGDCRRSSHGVLAQARPSHLPQLAGRKCRELLINLSAPLLFLFLTSRSFPSPWYTLCHILASFLVLRYCHLPFLSRSLYPSVSHFPVPLSSSPSSFSLQLAHSLFPPSSSISTFFFSKLTSHSHKGHSPSYYRSGTGPIRITIRATALLLIQPPSVILSLDGLSRA